MAGRRRAAWCHNQTLIDRRRGSRAPLPVLQKAIFHPLGPRSRRRKLPSTIAGAALAGERAGRGLTAIMAADVAGYSRLMGADEEGTLAQLKAHRRALLDPKIAEHRGRIVKTTGDGMLVEFASVVD